MTQRPWTPYPLVEDLDPGLCLSDLLGGHYQCGWLIPKSPDSIDSYQASSRGRLSLEFGEPLAAKAADPKAEAGRLRTQKHRHAELKKSQAHGVMVPGRFRFEPEETDKDYGGFAFQKAGSGPCTLEYLPPYSPSDIVAEIIDETQSRLSLAQISFPLSAKSERLKGFYLFFDPHGDGLYFHAMVSEWQLWFIVREGRTSPSR